jgi:predicted acyl esterase
MLIGTTWIDYYAHLQGTLRAWLQASSRYKWLYTYSERKWQGLYTPMEARDMQRKFFDQFLRGVESGILETPPVRLSVQDKLLDHQVRYEKEFPLKRTQYKKLYLDARSGKLNFSKPESEAKVSYDSGVSPVSQVFTQENKIGPEGKASFRVTFKEDSEIIGYLKLKVFVSPEDATDMDLFVTLRKYNADGHEVCFDCDAAPGRMPVALGWLRLSKRQLNQELSSEWMPVQKSVTPGELQQKVKPGEIVSCEIAVWPASVLFHAGEQLAVEISGKYGVKDDLLRGYNDRVNNGRHSVYTGGKYDSYLLVPFIPQARSFSTFGGRKVVED